MHWLEDTLRSKYGANCRSSDEGLGVASIIPLHEKNLILSLPLSEKSILASPGLFVYVRYVRISSKSARRPYLRTRAFFVNCHLLAGYELVSSSSNNRLP